MVQIDAEICIGCGLCVRDCPVRNLEMDGAAASVKGRCMLCGHCFAICPSHAVALPEYPLDGVLEDIGAAPVDGESFLMLTKMRRSVRHFEQRKLPRDLLAAVIEAGRFAPTAVNAQDTSYVVVQDELPRFRELVWNGFREVVGQLRAAGMPPEVVQKWADIADAHDADQKDDPLFFGAPALLVILSPHHLNGGLASGYAELMAAASGLGALVSGMIQRSIGASDEAQAFLGMAEDTQIASCLLLGYPDVRYERTAPRREAAVVWI